MADTPNKGLSAVQDYMRNRFGYKKPEEKDDDEDEDKKPSQSPSPPTPTRTPPAAQTALANYFKSRAGR